MKNVAHEQATDARVEQESGAAFVLHNAQVAVDVRGTSTPDGCVDPAVKPRDDKVTAWDDDVAARDDDVAVRDDSVIAQDGHLVAGNHDVAANIDVLNFALTLTEITTYYDFIELSESALLEQSDNTVSTNAFQYISDSGVATIFTQIMDSIEKIIKELSDIKDTLKEEVRDLESEADDEGDHGSARNNVIGIVDEPIGRTDARDDTGLEIQPIYSPQGSSGEAELLSNTLVGNTENLGGTGISNDIATTINDVPDTPDDPFNFPSVSDNTVSTPENVTYVFNVSDFNFDAGDNGYPLRSVTIVDTAALGRLYLDADNDDSYDAGEEVMSNQTISRAAIAFGYLQYEPTADTSGAPYTTFTFKAFDGEDVTNTATMELDVIGDQNFTFDTSSGDPELNADYLAVNIPLLLNLPSGFSDTDTLSISIQNIPTYGMVFSGENLYIRAGSGKSFSVDVSDWDLRTLQFTASELTTSTYDITIVISVTGSSTYVDSATLTLPQFLSADTIYGIFNITGDAGDNYIIGSNSIDNIIAGGGNDFVYGRSQTDTIDAGDGNDIVQSGDNAETVNAGSGNDIVYGEANVDTLNGEDGNDALYGGRKGDDISGGDGDDVIGGTDGQGDTSGNDTFDGDAGIDTLTYFSSTLDMVINLSMGQATGQGTDTLLNIENVIGGTGNDIIIGDAADNILDGNKGDDSINGGDSNASEVDGDTVSYDSLVNNLTEEGVTVDLSIVTAQDTGGAGTDTMTNIENIIGSQYDDSLKGNSGDNDLTGGRGNDIFVATTGDDLITDFEDGADLIDVSELSITGFAQLSISDSVSGILIENVSVSLSVTLEGLSTTTTTIDADDFIFA